MLGKLEHLDESAVRRHAAEDQPPLPQRLPIGRIDLVPVAVPLGDLVGAVDAVRPGPRSKQTRVGAEPHGAAHVRHLVLRVQERDHGMARPRVELGRVGRRETAHVSRELDDGALQTQTDPEIGDLPLPDEPDRVDHPVDAALPEAARDEHAVEGFEEVGPPRLHILRRPPLDIHFDVVHGAAVDERLRDRLVRIHEIRVLPHHADPHPAVRRVLDPVHHRLPVVEVRRRRVEPELLADAVVHLLRAIGEREFVDRGHVARLDDPVHVDVAEAGDLLLDPVVEVVLRTAHEQVGLDSDAQEFPHRVLRRLRLQFAGRVDPGDEREVDEKGVLAAHILPELPDRFQERERLDVANGSADLRDHDVVIRRQAPCRRLDLVRHVRDDLDRDAEEVAAPLLRDDVLVDAARRDVVRLRERLVDEPFVVAEVEVGLRPVVRHVDFAVLERRHRPRVDVEVRVELLDRHAQAALDEQAPDRGRGDPLPQRGDDPSRDEDVLRR